MRAVPCRIQASSGWAGRALCRKRMDLAGSMPLAISAAAISRMLAASCDGSKSMVRACRSARKNRHSASSCIRTQRRMAPSRLPRCRSPVGWMPDTTRIGRSAGIGIGSPAPNEALELFPVRAAKDPDEWEIDQHPAAYDSNNPSEPMPDRALEPSTEHHTDSKERRTHRTGGDELACDARREPALDAEMPASMKDDVENDAVQPRADCDR